MVNFNTPFEQSPLSSSAGMVLDRQSDRQDYWSLVVGGFLLLLTCLSWTYLSRFFQFGTGHENRPILLFVGLYLASWAGFVAVFRVTLRRKGRVSLRLVLPMALLFRAVLIPSDLIQENDVYRYVLDGQVLRHGGNPYQHSPLVISELGPAELRAKMDSDEARTVLARIGYPHIATVYPPVAQVLFAAGTFLSGWEWIGQRLVFLMADLATLAALLTVLRWLGLQSGWILAYAWNPLVLKEAVNSVHMDVIVGLWILLLIGGLVRFEKDGRLCWVVACGVFFALAVLSKWYPVLLGPACLFYLQRRGRRTRNLAVFSLTAAVTGVAGIGPFLNVDWRTLTSGLSAYAAQWRMNEGAFTLLQFVSSRPRWVAALIVVLVALVVPWILTRIPRNRSAAEPKSCALKGLPAPDLLDGVQDQDSVGLGRGDGSAPRFRLSAATRHEESALDPTSVLDLAAAFQWILLLCFLFMPSPFPWYALPLAVLLVFQPDSPAGWATVVLSGVAGLYYLSFFYEYHGYSQSWWFWTRVVEHSVVWMILSLSALRASGLRTFGARFFRPPRSAGAFKRKEE